ncbi:zinc-binding dehydrogenase [candidate division KSB1 bacterium]|nr:zinc-binding dehydrogenase [candidate division KSB1 bacterium]
MKSKAIVFTASGQVEIKEIQLPKPGPGQVMTKTLLTGVSTGTETRVFGGGQPGCTFPLIPGYENVGEIVECGTGVELKSGTRVWVGSSNFTGQYCRAWGAHVEYALVDANQLIPIPDDVVLSDAIYTRVGGIAYHGIMRANVTAHDTVGVVGLGLIGHLALQIAKAFGAKVIGLDTDTERLEIAKKAGADFIINPQQENAQKCVQEITNGGLDVAIDATGIAETVDSTARLVHGKPWSPPFPPSARVVILGSYTRPIVFDYNDTLFWNEPDILPSRDTVPDDLKAVLLLLSQKKIQPRLIPARHFSFLEAPAAYKELLAKKLMRVIFSW